MDNLITVGAPNCPRAATELLVEKVLPWDNVRQALRYRRTPRFVSFSTLSHNSQTFRRSLCGTHEEQLGHLEDVLPKTT